MELSHVFRARASRNAHTKRRVDSVVRCFSADDVIINSASSLEVSVNETVAGGLAGAEVCAV